MFESEREAIFKKSWQCVAPAGEPARPGDFAVAPVGDFAVLVTRGRAGELRAFRNTCQHRGDELAACSAGNTRLFQWPYHAWSSGLDGNLVNGPYMRETRFRLLLRPAQVTAGRYLGVLRVRQL